MLKITYETYAPNLKRFFIDTRLFKDMEDYRLFTYSLFNGNVVIHKIERQEEQR